MLTAAPRQTKDTVGSVKTSLASIVKQDENKIHLLNAEKQPLDERLTLEEAQLTNSAIVYYVFATEHGCMS